MNKDYVYLVEIERYLGRYESRKNFRKIDVYSSYKKAYAGYMQSKRSNDDWLMSSTEYDELDRTYRKYTVPNSASLKPLITIEETVNLCGCSNPFDSTRMFIKYKLTKQYIK